MIACEVQEFAKSHGMTELQNICEYIMAVTITTESCMRFFLFSFLFFFFFFVFSSSVS